MAEAPNAPPPPPPPQGETGRAWWPRCLFWAAVAAMLGVNCSQSMKQGWWDPQEKGKNGSDFTAFYSAGELARRGEVIYDYQHSSTPRRPFIYPPMFAVFPMAPLSLLPHNAALFVFWALNIALFCASLWLLRAVLWPGAPDGLSPTLSLWRQPETGLVLAVLVCWRFLNDNLRLGNANMYILFLLALTLYLLARHRGFLAGLSVALALAFKVTPGLFGLYFLWTRRGWALAGGALGLALFLVLVPGGVLGFSQNWDLLQAFARHASGAIAGKKDAAGSESAAATVGWKQPLRESYEDHAAGISLRGAMQKLLSPSVALSRRDESESRTVNVLNLTVAQALLVANVLALALLALTIALTAPRWAGEAGAPLFLSLGLVTSAMVLISPLTRKAHLVVLLLPVAALIALLQQDRLSGAARRWAWAGLLVLGLHGVVFSKDIIGARASEVVQAAGAATFAVLLLYAATAVALRTCRGGRPVDSPVRLVSGRCEANRSSCS